jgi:hypothetical protein
MKRTLLTIAIVAAAGTAGAQTVTTPNVNVPNVGTPNAGAGNSTASGAAGAAGTTSYSMPSTSADSMINGGAAVKGNPGLNGAATGPTASGSGQLTTNAQTGVQTPAGQMNNSMSNSTSMGASANASANPNMANAPAQRLTGAAGTAQKRIEQDGYKSVQNLEKGADGLWHGTAMRGNTQVKVTVDRAGHVSAQ